VWTRFDRVYLDRHEANAWVCTSALPRYTEVCVIVFVKEERCPCMYHMRALPYKEVGAAHVREWKRAQMQRYYRIEMTRMCTAYMYLYEYIEKYVKTYIRMYTHTHTYKYMYIYMYISIYVYIDTLIFIHTRMYT